jgi:glucose-6-phosphate isomerase
MRILKASGLPIYFDDEDFSLSYKDGLTCLGSGHKEARQMKDLLYRPEGIDDSQRCYYYYRDIAFEKDRELFQKYDFRYDISVIMPGTLNGELKKTSGHYHGYIKGTQYTYPEVYEVLLGKAMYIMQKVSNFDSPEPLIEDLKAVIVQEGQAVVIPPYYGHCSVNIGEGPLVFSNIAVVSCPLHYEPIQEKHGLSIYVVKSKDGIEYIKNPYYKSVPDAKTVYPREDADMGIRFGAPVYGEFIRNPQKFSYLLKPERFITKMDTMLG